MKDVNEMRFSIYHIIGILIIFILGLLFGYSFGSTSRQETATATQQSKNATTKQNAESTNPDDLLIYNLQGAVQKIEGQTIILKTDNGQEYRASTNENTVLKKIRPADAPESEGEAIYDINLTDLQNNDSLYVESNDNIGNSAEFSAKYIEVLPPKK